MQRGVVRGSRILVTVAVVAAIAGLLAPPVSASGERTERNDIFITGDSELNPANGVRSGSGTARDPYVISGWDVGNISIRDTDAHLLIKDNTITGQLILNWNGDGVNVVNNTVGDLRVNQNVKRTGYPTSGRITNNTFGIVGQLRHFDGVFENNTVTGRASALDSVFVNRSVLFDGFHGSKFRNNTINGFVEVKLHGHHHGSGFEEDSHYHGPAREGHAGHADEEDHSTRYHEVHVTNNRITAAGEYALLWNDRAHVVNDRTNASETNPDLNKEHVHYTRIHLTGNKLIGAGLMVDVFNADDERHLSTKTGLVEIRNNDISLQRETTDNLMWARKDGITINSAVDAVVKVSGNVVRGEPFEQRDPLDEEFTTDSGILLNDVDKARVYLRGNAVMNLLYGIRASQMTKSVKWWVDRLSTKAVEQDVYWDNTVKNQPRRRP